MTPADYFPDLNEWPENWMGVEEDRYRVWAACLVYPLYPAPDRSRNGREDH